MSSILVAIITGGCGLLGSIIVAVITAISTKSAVTHKLEVAQAVTDTKLEELTREVRRHNSFAERVPVLEEKMKTVNEKIEDLERSHHD